MAFWPIRFDLIASGWEPDVHSVDLGYIEARLEEQIEQAMESAVKFLSVLSDISEPRRDEYSSIVRAKLQGKKYEWMARARRTRALRLSKTAEVREQSSRKAPEKGSVAPNARRFDTLKPMYLTKKGSTLTLSVLTKLAGYERDRDRPSNTEVKAWLKGKPRSAAAGRNFDQAVARLESELS